MFKFKNNKGKQNVTVLTKVFPTNTKSFTVLFYMKVIGFSSMKVYFVPFVWLNITFPLLSTFKATLLGAYMPMGKKIVRCPYSPEK